MGKILVIKGADFSRVAIDNVTPGTLKYETIPDLNKEWEGSAGVSSEFKGYVQITVDGISCYHSLIAGIEGKFTNETNLQLIKVNALTKEYSVLKSFVGNGSIQTIMLDSIVKFETNEYIGIGIPPQQDSTKGLYYDKKPGNCTSLEINLNNTNNRFSYRRIYVE